MKKPEIQSLLTKNHGMFARYIKSLSAEDFLITFQDRWSAGQRLQHVYLITLSLAWGLKLPKLALKLAFGNPKSVSRDFDSVAEDYRAVLNCRARLLSLPSPGLVRFGQREKLLKRLLLSVEKLCLVLDRFSEGDLDRIMIPHVLMGRLTIREMMYFVAIHVNHHGERARLNLNPGFALSPAQTA